MTPESAIRFVWLIWLVSWLAAAAWSEKTVRRPGFGREAIYRLLTVGGAILLFGHFSTVPFAWQVNAAVAWGMVALAVIGMLFAWWARIHLGRLWSGTVTRKMGHHIIATGPYAVVRHPIYTGLLLAILATSVVSGSAFGLAGAMLIVAGFYVKARLEERFLREQLGAQEYEGYARRVPMLVPFVRI